MGLHTQWINALMGADTQWINAFGNLQPIIEPDFTCDGCGHPVDKRYGNLQSIIRCAQVAEWTPIVLEQKCPLFGLLANISHS